MALLLKEVTVLLIITFTEFGHQVSFPCFNRTLLDTCMVGLQTQNLCELIQKDTRQNKTRFSVKDVETNLSLMMNISDCVADHAPGQTTLRSFGNYLLNMNEKLASTLLEKPCNYTFVQFSVGNLEVIIYVVEHKTTLTEIPTLITSQASLEIDLIRISRHRRASVVFLSYTNMESIFKPSFFATNINSNKALMSVVVTFALPQTQNTWILEIIDFTLKHTKELEPGAILSCMNFESQYWPRCFVYRTNATHTACSCYYGTTFALISETNPCMGESMSVALLSYANMMDVLENNFNEFNSQKALSILVSATSSYNFALTKPVNITLRHLTDVDPWAILSCSHRNWYYWDTGYCNITQTNRTHTVCSCNTLETLALFMLTMPCNYNESVYTAKMFLDQILDNTNENLPQELLIQYLNLTVYIANCTMNVVSDDLISFGNMVVSVTTRLVSILMKNTETNISIPQLEFGKVGFPSNEKITDRSQTSLYIQDTSDSGSVTFVIYDNISYFFKPSLYKTIFNTKKTMMSIVVSVSSTQNTDILKITFRHINDLEPRSFLSCVSWNDTEWNINICTVDMKQSNSSHTVCSCKTLGVFALIMETDPCQDDDLTMSCIDAFLNQNLTIKELPLNVVEQYLTMTVHLMSHIKSDLTAKNTCMANSILGGNENLVSTLVNITDKPVQISYNTSFDLENIEVRVSVVYKFDTKLYSNLELTTTNASLGIDLISIAKNNKESAAVAFLSYDQMSDFLTPNDRLKSLMSVVVSATLPKTPSTWLSQPINITFKHIGTFNSEDKRSCVYWNENQWTELGCEVSSWNATHTQCSCDHLTTFALIKEIVPCRTLFGATLSEHCEIVLNMTVAQGVGIFFLTLCLLTFAFCCQNSSETNTAIIHLCLNLLLFDILDLPVYQIQLQPPHACAIMNSLRRFFFISAFMWMFIQTILIFLFLKNVSQIRSNLQHGLRWDWINLFGYLVPVVVVIVCTVMNTAPNYVNGQCSESVNEEETFNTPILFIVAANVFLYTVIITMMVFTLKQLQNMNAQRQNKNSTDLIMRAMFKSLAQFIILGCYWILRYIPSGNVGLYNLFLFLNTQQGTFIFIVHCLLNQEVRQRYREILAKICCFQNPGVSTNTVTTHETQH